MSAGIRLVAGVLFAGSGEGSPGFPQSTPSDAHVAMVSLMLLRMGYAQGRKKPTTNLQLISVPSRGGFSPFLCLQRCYHQTVHLGL